MAQYVKISKDLNNIKEKFMLGLTKRQIICFGLGVALGGIVYYLTYEKLGTTVSGVLLFMIAAPLILTGMYEKNGFTLDKIVLNYIRYRFQYPQIRTYQTENIYSSIEQQIIIDKEMKMLETGQKPINIQNTTVKKKTGVCSSDS